MPATSTAHASAVDVSETTSLMSNADESAFSFGTHQRTQREAPAPDDAPRQHTRSSSVARRQERRRARRASLWARTKYYVPAMSWIPSYTFSLFAGDLQAACSLTSLLVPQSLSYATSLAGLPPTSGLFGAAIPPIVYAFLGTSRQLSVGPEAALSLIMGQALSAFLREEATHVGHDLSAAHQLKISLAFTSAITFEAGVITLLLGLFRLGFLDAVLSRALLRGFLTSVALVILVGQLVPMLGLETLLASAPPIDNTPDKLLWVLDHLSSTHMLTAAMSGVALLVLISAKTFKLRLANRKGFKFLSYIPEVLAVVIGATLLTALLRLDRDGLQILGAIEPGKFALKLPIKDGRRYLRQTLETSAVIAVLGFLDSIVGAKDASNNYDYAVSPNRELCALGAANIVTSCVAGTLPGYGSITRSRLAGSTGARSQMASLLTGIFVLTVSLFFLSALHYLPKCILSAIVCVVVWSILSETPHEVLFFWRMGSTSSLLLMGITASLTLFVSVEAGIGVSVFLSMLLCIRQSSEIKIRILGRVPGSEIFEQLDDEDLDDLDEIAGVLIVRIRDVALTFANAAALKDRLRRLERYGKGTHHPSEPASREATSVLILHLGDVESIDAGAAQLLHEAVKSYIDRQVLVYWAHLHSSPRQTLERADVLGLCGDPSLHIHPTVQLCLDALKDEMDAFDGI